MTESQLQALDPALIGYLEGFRPSCRSSPTFGHMGMYVRGLLSDLDRKSAEPIGLAAGTPPRTVQEFLRDHEWDYKVVREAIQTQVAQKVRSMPNDGLGVVGLVDETSVRKQGTKTPGVNRQYLGCLGKVGNGIVTVHLGVCHGRYKTLIDGDLFLPEAWSVDRERCLKAGIPDEIVHRPKWQIALEQLDRSRKNSVVMEWLTFDAEYGKAPKFLAGLDTRNQRFVGEVGRTWACCAVGKDGAVPGPEVTSRPAEELVRSCSLFRSQPWQVLRLSRETTNEQVWRVKAGQVWGSGEDGWSARSYWLIWASSDQTGEEKFFVSNAPSDIPVEKLVRVGFRRANVEHAFRVCKSELGFGHYEGQNYTGLMRHMMLCLGAMGFVADHTDRLRGEKSGPDNGAGMSGVSPFGSGMGENQQRHDRAGVLAHGGNLSPTSESSGRNFEEKASGRGPSAEKTQAEKAKTQGKIKRPEKVAL
jgi:SRSO17 transposase